MQQMRTMTAFLYCFIAIAMTRVAVSFEYRCGWLPTASQVTRSRPAATGSHRSCGIALSRVPLSIIRSECSLLYAKRPKKGNKSSKNAEEPTIVDNGVSFAGEYSDTPNDASSAALVNAEELDDDVKAKLKAEIASPFYRLRQFAFVALGMAGSIGALTAVPQLVLSISNGDDLTTTATNVVVDIGSVVTAVWLWGIDAERQNKKVETFGSKQRQQSNRMSSQESKAREELLSKLPVEIAASEMDGNVTRVVSVGDLQSRGRQHLVVVAGDRNFVRDAVISARLQGDQLFNDRQTMVVPIVARGEPLDDPSAPRGFAVKESLLGNAFFAKPTQVDVWLRFVQEEVEAAGKQGQDDALAKGLSLFVKNDGRIIRRGLGVPPWKTALDEEFSKTKKEKD